MKARSQLALEGFLTVCPRSVQRHFPANSKRASRRLTPECACLEQRTLLAQFDMVVAPGDYSTIGFGTTLSYGSETLQSFGGDVPTGGIASVTQLPITQGVHSDPQSTSDGVVGLQTDFPSGLHDGALQHPNSIGGGTIRTSFTVDRYWPGVGVNVDVVTGTTGSTSEVDGTPIQFVLFPDYGEQLGDSVHITITLLEETVPIIDSSYGDPNYYDPYYHVDNTLTYAFQKNAASLTAGVSTDPLENYITLLDDTVRIGDVFTLSFADHARISAAANTAKHHERLQGDLSLDINFGQTQLRPELQADSLSLSADHQSVSYQYSVTRADLPVDTTGGLFWATGSTPDSIIDPSHPAYSFPLQRAMGVYGPTTIPFSALGVRPNEATHLLMVLDLSHLVDQSDQSNTVADLTLPPPATSDIFPSPPSWNVAVGGVDYSYSITFADLSVPTTTALYWSADSTFDQNVDTLIPGSVSDTKTALGTYSIHVDAKTLGTPPAGTRYLLAVVDPGNTIPELVETNNTAAWQSNLSGVAWLEAAGVSQLDNVGTYANSTKLSDLDPAFRGKVQQFVAALNASGATIKISSTRLPKERAYLMHYAWAIAHDQVGPAAVPAMYGIDIRWDHGDAALSKSAAQEMVDFFGMTHDIALLSRQTQGLAIDMSISWVGDLVIQNAAHRLVPIATGPRNANNATLARVAASFGVYRNFASATASWSSDGH